MINKCKSCISRYEYKTGGECRYCIWNNERHRYLCRDRSREDKDHHRYVDGWHKESDITY